jgi:hypothetical protein
MTTLHSVAATLIRTVDGVEWPAPGRWDIRPGWSLDVRPVRLLARRRDRVAIRDGTLDIAEPGSGSTLQLAVGAAPAVGLTAVDVNVTITTADRLGRWQLAGTAAAGDDRLGVTGEVRYHGTFRAGSRASVWLGLDVVLHDRRRTHARRVALAGQLTALAPDLVAHPA